MFQKASLDALNNLHGSIIYDDRECGSSVRHSKHSGILAMSLERFINSLMSVWLRLEKDPAHEIIFHLADQINPCSLKNLGDRGGFVSAELKILL